MSPFARATSRASQSHARPGKRDRCRGAHGATPHWSELLQPTTPSASPSRGGRRDHGGPDGPGHELDRQLRQGDGGQVVDPHPRASVSAAAPFGSRDMATSYTTRRSRRLVCTRVSARVGLSDRPYHALKASASGNHCSATPSESDGRLRLPDKMLVGDAEIHYMPGR
jgi:hypothetical protein